MHELHGLYGLAACLQLVTAFALRWMMRADGVMRMQQAHTEGSRPAPGHFGAGSGVAAAKKL